MKAADYIPTSRADARAYACFVMENFEREDWPKAKRRRKRRGLSLARAITQAKKTGAAVTVAPDGAITLQFGEKTASRPEKRFSDSLNAVDPANEWDTL